MAGGLMEKKLVFIVDDEPDFLELMEEALKSDFDIRGLTTGRAALEKIEDETPNIILLDVGLPDMDGYQVCKEIKKADRGDNMSVIFISGHDSLEQRLSGYNSGADDYIAKPVEVDEILAKVHAVSKFQSSKEYVRTQEIYSREMAFQAMSEAAQYGSVLQFIKTASQSTNNEEIAQAVSGICSEFHLNSSIQIRGDDALTLRFNSGACSPIEIQLFELLSKQGRVYTFNKRYMFNDLHVSILITNMPIEDEIKAGRLNDLLATIVEAAESAVTNLARFKILKKLLETTQSTVTTISNSYSENQNETTAIMDRMIKDMGLALDRIGLTEEQEAYFVKLAESTLEELIHLHDEERKVELDLEGVVAGIKKSINDV